LNPYVFIVGCPRSGTTLLERIVNAHPELALVHESRWITRIYEERRGLTPDGLVMPKLAERLCEPRSTTPFAISASEMADLVRSQQGAPFAQLVTALFDRYAEHHSKPLAGDKSPGYVRYLPLLHQLWPRAKFIHIVRDGRDVYLSVLDWGKGATRFAGFADDPAVTAARWWEWYVRLGREGAAALGPDRYHELRYESLVADPAEVAAEICEFLAIPYDPRMLKFHEGRVRDDPRLDAKKAWRPVTPGLRSWRNQMDPAAISRFEAVAGNLLFELGYPLSHAPRARIDARVAARAHAFDREVRARRRPTPQAWTGVAE
jgi:hypothetical protein